MRTMPVVISAFYFVYYAAAAAFIPNLPLIFEDAGLSASETGALLALPPLIGIVVAPALAVAADVTGRGRTILVMALCGTGFAAIGLGLVAAFIAALGVMLIFAISIAPVVPFADGAAVAVTAKSGGYARLRLWGGVGWGVAAPLAGWGIDQTDLGIASTVFVVGMGVLLALAYRMPVSAKRPVSVRRVRSVLASSSGWLALLGGAFVMGAASGTIGFLFVLLRDLGASSLTMGAALAIATVSELVGWVVAPRVIRRIGVNATMMLGGGFAALRLIAYWLFPSVEAALAAQLLHGLTFALPWAAGVMWSARLSPGLPTTGQGIFSAVGLGLGPAAGLLVAGVVAESTSAVSMFGLMGLALAGLTLALASLSGVVGPRADSGRP